MPEYRYVDQGEYYITDNPEVTLVTSGMTDCIAITFIDKREPKKRMLVHLDGFTLMSLAQAQSNLGLIKKEFTKITGSDDFNVYIFGGQKEFRNYKMLLPTLKHLNISITKLIDVNDFCASLKTPLQGKSFFSPMNVCATLICSPDGEPSFVSYDSRYFSPALSEESLAGGQGLLDKKDQIKYKMFFEINDKILEKHPDIAQTVRTSSDEEWVSEHLYTLKTTSIEPHF